MSNVKIITRHKLQALAAGFLVLPSILFAVDKTAWFKQDYEGLSSSDWSDVLGTWSNTVGNVFVAGECPHIEIGGGSTPLVFSPYGSEETTNALTSVIVDATFCATPNYEEGMMPAPQAGLSLTYDAATDTSLVFVGYTAKGWTELSAADVVPAENVQYRVGVDVKYDSLRVGNPWKTVKRVRYSVDGHPLRDAAGHEWLDGAADAVPRISKIAFTGQGGGKVGAFAAMRERVPAARATIDVPIVRAKAGTAFSFTDSVRTNEGAVLTGELTWKWYAGSWRSEYGDEPLSEKASIKPTAAEYARWIKGEAYDDVGYVCEGRFWYSKLPVLYITTDDGKMPTSAKEEHDGWMKIQGNDEFKDDYNNKISIKVRGNSTKGLAKKPYKLKLDSKANLFNLGGAKNKHWVLLANYLDESLMRNKLAYDYAAEVGLVHMKSTWVDVVFNGEYAGVYQVCPHIRVAKDRVDIFDWEAAGEDAADAIADGVKMAKADKKALETLMSENLAWVTSDAVTYKDVTYKVSDYYEDFDKLDISGGYLFESSHEYDEVSKFTCLNKSGDKTNLLVFVMLNKPEFLYTNPTMMEYCSNYWQRTADAWAGVKGRNPQGEHWSELCNVPSAAGFWWVNASMLNADSSYKSRYCYLPHDGKLTFGPVWDFDWGVGGVPVRGKPENEPDYKWWGPGLGGGIEGWQREWCSDPLFLKSVHKCYTDTRAYFRRFSETGGLIDQYYAYLDESARANVELWPNLAHHDHSAGWCGEKGEVAILKRFLANRLIWLDANMASYEAFTNSIGIAYTNGTSGKLPPTNPYLADVPAPVPTSLDGKVTQSDLESWMNVNYPEVTNLYGVAFAAQYQALVDKLDEEGRSPTGKPQPFAADFIAGTDPRDPESLFKIVQFELKDGEVLLTWEPDLNEAGTKAIRAYLLLGKETLDPAEEWKPPTAASKFFKVQVSMP